MESHDDHLPGLQLHLLLMDLMGLFLLTVRRLNLSLLLSLILPRVGAELGPQSVLLTVDSDL
jgi:hypothetical protein